MNTTRLMKAAENSLRMMKDTGIGMGETELRAALDEAKEAPAILDALKNLYEHPVHMKDCALLKSSANTCDCAKGKAVKQAYEVLTKLGV